MFHFLAMIQEGMIQAQGITGDLGKGLGAALTVIGAAIGIGWIGSRMTENMARQPEIAGNIQTASIILAALIEGATLFSLVIMFLM